MGTLSRPASGPLSCGGGGGSHPVFLRADGSVVFVGGASGGGSKTPQWLLDLIRDAYGDDYHGDVLEKVPAALLREAGVPVEYAAGSGSFSARMP